MSTISNRHHLMSKTFLFSRWGILMVLGIVSLIAAVTTSILMFGPMDTSLIDNSPPAPVVNEGIEPSSPSNALHADDCGVTAGEFARVSDSNSAIVVQSDGILGGETLSMPLILSQAPDGLAGYIMEIRLDNPNAAKIRDVEFPDFGLTRNVSNTGVEARFAVVDLMRTVESGAANSTMAILNIETLGEGTSGLSINVLQMDDDSGNSILPEIISGTLTVC